MCVKDGYKQLGPTDIRVSPLGLGCWAIGGPFWLDGKQDKATDVLWYKERWDGCGLKVIATSLSPVLKRLIKSRNMPRPLNSAPYRNDKSRKSIHC